MSGKRYTKNSPRYMIRKLHKTCKKNLYYSPIFKTLHCRECNEIVEKFVDLSKIRFVGTNGEIDEVIYKDVTGKHNAHRKKHDQGFYRGRLKKIKEEDYDEEYFSDKEIDKLYETCLTVLLE